MFALGAKAINDSSSAYYMSMAKEIAHTCHESYSRTPTGLGPESFRFNEPGNEAQTSRHNEKYYILRPETFETYFILWRLTKDPIYREWGWEAVQVILTSLRSPYPWVFTPESFSAKMQFNIGIIILCKNGVIHTELLASINLGPFSISFGKRLLQHCFM